MNEYFDWINNKIRKSVETTASFETLDYPDVVVTHRFMTIEEMRERFPDPATDVGDKEIAMVYARII